MTEECSLPEGHPVVCRCMPEHTREELETWPMPDLNAAAMECQAEEGPAHCWRCMAWDIWYGRVIDGWPIV